MSDHTDRIILQALRAEVWDACSRGHVPEADYQAMRDSEPEDMARKLRYWRDRVDSLPA